MLLIQLTKIFIKSDNDEHDAAWFLNPEHIASVMPHNKGSSIAVRGFNSNHIVRETPEEIIDAIRQEQHDEYSSFWDAAIPQLAQAIELVDRERIERDDRSGGGVVRDLLRRPYRAGSGTLSDAAGLPPQQD